MLSISHFPLSHRNCEPSVALNNHRTNLIMVDTQDILFERRGQAGVVTLNKPSTLNAVTDAMLRELDRHLDEWERDDAISRVIIKAVPGRAFSAGGDIRYLYEEGTSGHFDFGFFAREYTLNARIAHFSKPYIALVDGIVMGGGVGVSFHGSHRIAGEGMSFAMPEVGIGFFPDVGGSYLLSRLPGKTGLYLGLTGTRVTQADAIWSGLTTSVCASQDLPALEDALCNAGSVDSITNQFSYACEPGTLEAHSGFINRTFDGGSVLDIMRRLQDMSDAQGEGAQWAAKTLAVMKQKSPTSLAIAFQQISRGAALTMAQCMQMEYRILKRLLPGSEFYEGIRAAIVDKDNDPQWQPASSVEVDANAVAAHFEPLPEDEELVLP